MGKTNTRALSLKKPPRFKASCLQSWRFFDIPCYWALTKQALILKELSESGPEVRKKVLLAKSAKRTLGLQEGLFFKVVE